MAEHAAPARVVLVGAAAGPERVRPEARRLAAEPVVDVVRDRVVRRRAEAGHLAEVHHRHGVRGFPNAAAEASVQHLHTFVEASGQVPATVVGVHDHRAELPRVVREPIEGAVAHHGGALDERDCQPSADLAEHLLQGLAQERTLHGFVLAAGPSRDHPCNGVVVLLRDVETDVEIHELRPPLRRTQAHEVNCRSLRQVKSPPMESRLLDHDELS